MMRAPSESTFGLRVRFFILDKWRSDIHEGFRTRLEKVIREFS
jgi:hypothetical protein